MAHPAMTLGRFETAPSIGCWRQEPVRRPASVDGKETAMKNILVAYDGTDPAHRALETGIELAKRFDASLAIVSVVPVHAGRVRTDPWDDRSVHDKELAEARDIAAAQGIEAELIEPAGEPAKAIERVAEIGRFDTIVVGSRGLGTLSRFLEGSVSAHVATHAQTTVVVAR
jgi:nucleotide-binding universal stress UspA family protein